MLLNNLNRDLHTQSQTNLLLYLISGDFWGAKSWSSTVSKQLKRSAQQQVRKLHHKTTIPKIISKSNKQQRRHLRLRLCNTYLEVSILR